MLSHIWLHTFIVTFTTGGETNHNRKLTCPDVVSAVRVDFNNFENRFSIIMVYYKVLIQILTLILCVMVQL